MAHATTARGGIDTQCLSSEKATRLPTNGSLPHHNCISGEEMPVFINFSPTFLPWGDIFMMISRFSLTQKSDEPSPYPGMVLPRSPRLRVTTPDFQKDRVIHGGFPSGSLFSAEKRFFHSSSFNGYRSSTSSVSEIGR